MNVADIMTSEFESVHEGSTLLDAMRHLRDCPLVEDEIGIKCVVVLDAGGRLTGILTQSDVVGEILFPYFVRELAVPSDGATSIPTMRDADFRGLASWAQRVKVRDVMSRNPVTISPDADLFAAADTIVSRKVKSVPVMKDEKVQGIVYRSTLYRHIAEAILDNAPR